MQTIQPILKSSKLANVCYDIRGPVLDRAKQMEEDGHYIIKLNIGNPASFGFDVPEEILQDVIHNLSDASGYCDSKGLFAARKAIMHYTQEKHIRDVQMEDIYIGNGVSELIVMAMQALLNSGDEVLIPAPDYPLWTAAVVLAGGTARYYVCDEQSGWLPDLDDIRAKVTANTRAIVIINPNNPTGTMLTAAELESFLRRAPKKVVVVVDEAYNEYLAPALRCPSIAWLASFPNLIVTRTFSKIHGLAALRDGNVSLDTPMLWSLGFVAIVVRARLAGMDESIFEAARDLGASPWQAFRLVTLPLIMPAVVAGALADPESIAT